MSVRKSANGGSLMIGGYSEGHLLKQAEKTVEEKSRITPIFDKEAEGRIPKFETGELTIGKVLGKGGFCVVSEVTKIQLNQNGVVGSQTSANHHQSDDHFHDIVQDRDFMESQFVRKGKDYRYAIKILKPEATKDYSTFVKGVCDLAIEARFLAVIRHPNIIKMRAANLGTPYSREYFIVLDKLYDILSKTIVTWKKKQPKGLAKMMDRSGKKANESWVERINVAHDIAFALKYLHSNKIIYRDLKPDNIGFDVRGDVKIFDFGLSRQLPSSGKLSDGTYKMTAETGSPLYMAPEVALDKPYNETCDCYSFGILLWQICELDEPFQGFTYKLLEKNVFRGGSRPKLDPKWPAAIAELMGKCWSPSISKRPSMEQITNDLRGYLEENMFTGIEEASDASFKSQHSLHALQKK